MATMIEPYYGPWQNIHCPILQYGMVILDVLKLNEKECVLLCSVWDGTYKVYKVNVATNAYEKINIDLNRTWIGGSFIDPVEQKLYILGDFSIQHTSVDFSIYDLSGVGPGPGPVFSGLLNCRPLNFAFSRYGQIQMVVVGDAVHMSIVTDESFASHCIWHNFRGKKSPIVEFVATISWTSRICYNECCLFGIDNNVGNSFVQMFITNGIVWDNKMDGGALRNLSTKHMFHMCGDDGLRASSTISTDCGQYIISFGSTHNKNIFIFDNAYGTVRVSGIKSPLLCHGKYYPSHHAVYQRYYSQEECLTSGFVCANNRRDYPESLVSFIQRFVALEWVYLMSTEGQHWKVNLCEVFT